MKLLSLSLPLILATFPLLSAAEKDPLEAYPAATDGNERFVIVLPEKSREEEVDFKVEILVGKEIMTDSVNVKKAGGMIEEKIVEGWGYPFYELKKFGPVASTMMAPPPGEEQVKRFVSTQSLTIRYNSRLPVVVYAPEDCEVRYRIWSAQGEFLPVPAN